MVALAVRQMRVPYNSKFQGIRIDQHIHYGFTQYIHDEGRLQKDDRLLRSIHTRMNLARKIVAQELEAIE